MSKTIQFTVLGVPQPQGSMRAISTPKGARLASDNKAMRPWRQEVGWGALRARGEAGYSKIFAGEHVPVGVSIKFFMSPPVKMPKGRVAPSVKPDIDKLIRACLDAMTGIMWVDDGQVVAIIAVKYYGNPARAEFVVEAL